MEVNNVRQATLPVGYEVVWRTELKSGTLARLQKCARCNQKLKLNTEDPMTLLL